MSEKRGMQGKLKYDFNTANAVFIKKKDTRFFRVTERDFRSYYGERFILENGEYKKYEGPVYYWNTNKIVKEPIEDQIQMGETEKRNTLVRPHERHLLD
jgi:hypothetical protein